MSKKLFVLFVVVILAGSLGALYVYDKKELQKSEANNQMLENQELEEESYEQLEESGTEDGETEVKTEEIDTEEDVDKDRDIMGTLPMEKRG